MSQSTAAPYDTPSRRRFTVDELHRLVAAGIVAEDDRIELLDGELVEMVPIGEPHASIVDIISNGIAPARLDVVVRTQGPVRLTEYSQPVPDVAVLRASSHRYRDRHPGPADVLLLVEVSDSTLAFDRGVKLPLYANSGIEEVWIVDVTAGRIEQHTRPGDGIYRQIRIHAGADVVQPQLVHDFSLVVASLFE
jgi:Uma2 family endonuclease